MSGTEEQSTEAPSSSSTTHGTKRQRLSKIDLQLITTLIPKGLVIPRESLNEPEFEKILSDVKTKFAKTRPERASLCTSEMIAALSRVDPGSETYVTLDMGCKLGSKGEALKKKLIEEHLKDDGNDSEMKTPGKETSSGSASTKKRKRRRSVIGGDESLETPPNPAPVASGSSSETMANIEVPVIPMVSEVAPPVTEKETEPVVPDLLSVSVTMSAITPAKKGKSSGKKSKDSQATTEQTPIHPLIVTTTPATEGSSNPQEWMENTGGDDVSFGDDNPFAPEGELPEDQVEQTTIEATQSKIDDVSDKDDDEPSAKKTRNKKRASELAFPKEASRRRMKRLTEKALQVYQDEVDSYNKVITSVGDEGTERDRDSESIGKQSKQFKVKHKSSLSIAKQMENVIAYFNWMQRGGEEVVDGESSSHQPPMMVLAVNGHNNSAILCKGLVNVEQENFLSALLCIDKSSHNDN